MEQLNLHGNRLTDQELQTKLQQLEHDFYTELNLNKNRLNTVPYLTPYPQLQRLVKLNLSYNRIKQWRSGCMPQGIQDIYLEKNNISEVGDFSTLSQLEKLDLAHNNIHTVHGAQFPTGIQEIYLGRNKISEVGDFTTLSQLEKLDLAHNNIHTVHGTQFPTGIQEIYLGRNKISEVGDFTTLSQLKNLNLSGNNIHRVHGTQFPTDIQAIDLGRNKISEVGDFTTLSQLKKLDLAHNNIHTVHGAQFPTGIQEIHLWNNKISDVGDFTTLSQLKELNLEDNNIHRVHGTQFPTGIQEIYLGRNKISEVGDFTTLSQLKKLNLEDNNIHRVHGAQFPTGIQAIDLGRNKISDVGDFTTLSQLKELNLEDNNIHRVHGTQFPTGIQEIYLGRNKISEVGDFTTLSQLEKLDLAHNNIHTVHGAQFPTGIQEIHLWNNKISDVGDFTTLSQLKELNLEDNNIHRVHGTQFPTGIQEIYLGRNKISDVGDFTTLSQLKKLYLAYNNIHTVHGTQSPTGIQEIMLWNNKITHVPETEHLTHLKELNLRNNKIQKLQSIKQYMVHSYQLRGNHITHIAKECFSSSEIYEYLRRNIDTEYLEQPPREVFERGLEAVTEYFMHKLIRGSRNRLVLVGPTEAGKSSFMKSLLAGEPVLVLLQDRTQVIDVQTLEIAPDEFLEIFDQGGHEVYSITNHLFMCPRSTVLLVHDVTKVSDEEITETVDILCQALHKNPGNELHIVLTHIDELEPEALDANSQRIMQKIKTIISKEIENTERLAAGKLPEHEKESRVTLLSNLKKTQQEMKCFEVSSKSFAGIDHLKEFLKDLMHQRNVVVPDIWLHFYALIQQQQKCFLDMDDVQAISQNVAQFNIVTALNYFNDIGMVLYFEKNPNLSNYVFHQIEFLVNAFKATFHHNILGVFDYDTDKHLQSQFMKPEFDMAIKQYQHEGLLSLKLLECFWRKYQLKEEHKGALLQLMKAFDICYPVTSDESQLFLPWFVKNQESPRNIDVRHIWQTTDTLVSIQLNCVFFNRIPRNVFEMMCVRLQKLAIEKHYVGERSAWKNGLVVQFGSTKCMILRDEAASTIKVCIQGKVDNLIEVWMVMQNYYGNIEDVLHQWNGVLKAIIFICSHCNFFGKKPAKEWLLDVVFPRAAVTTTHVTCSNDEAEVPRALVVALTDKTATAEKDVLAVKQYLQNQENAKAPAPKLLYVDCVHESADTFLLSWALPSVTVTGAVVEYKTPGGNWQRVPQAIKKNKYRFKGAADQFRVAFENRNGLGEFFETKPMPSLLDETMSEQDRKEIKSCHESFCRMTNISTISARLVSRGVIDVDEEVSRLLKNEGAFCAARSLMETIYRFKYRQLYFFKKTLIETGQDILAEAVPVRLEDGTEIELEDVC